jgi:hypothetical protein
MPQIITPHTIDPGTIVSSFLNEYYKHTMTTGWINTMRLFDRNCRVFFRDRYLGNSYDLLTYLTGEYIKRAYYDSLRPKWVCINENTILINVFGRVQFVMYSGFGTQIMYFNETFVLSGSMIDGKPVLSCTCHIIDF